MPEADSILYLILFSGLTGMLLAVLVLQLRISARLGKIERSLVGQLEQILDRGIPVEPSDDQSGGLFQTFLEEEPSRRLLTKGEQFAAYRRWRSEKGMNWSKP